VARSAERGAFMANYPRIFSVFKDEVMIRKRMRDRARELRKNSTPSEMTFWQFVRAHRLAGYSFRRQQVVGCYITDFVCFEKKLVIELDGAQHAENSEYDARRDAWFAAEGYRVLRIWNREWDENPEGVLQKVLEILLSE
jgi:very-short-patch-repair endonuclease